MKLNPYFNNVGDSNTRRALWKMQEGINDMAGLLVGQERYLVANKTTDAFFLSLIANGADPAMVYSSLATAEAAMTTGRGDSLVIMPGNHSLAADPVLSQNMSVFKGLQDWPLMNKRCRIGMSTTFTPFITVSGYGNLFQNLYTMHGTAAGDYVGWKIDGARNGFKGMHFGGPMVAAQGGHASYVGLDINGSENYFEGCVIGTDTIGRDEVSPNVSLAAETLTYFKDCVFLANLTDGDPVFFSVENTSGYTWAMFENCRFFAFSENMATAMTVAFDFTGGSTCAMVFDGNCQFINVSALSSASEDQYIWLPRPFATTTDTEAMRSVLLTI
jgi:hypothetical protein